jgi:hypothetical protein
MELARKAPTTDGSVAVLNSFIMIDTYSGGDIFVLRLPTTLRFSLVACWIKCLEEAGALNQSCSVWTRDCRVLTCSQSSLQYSAFHERDELNPNFKAHVEGAKTYLTLGSGSHEYVRRLARNKFENTFPCPSN